MRDPFPHGRLGAANSQQHLVQAGVLTATQPDADNQQVTWGRKPSLNKYGILLLGDLGRASCPARLAVRQLNPAIVRAIPNATTALLLLKKLSSMNSQHSKRIHSLPYIVLCPEHMDDMSWQGFLAAMHVHGLHRIVPVVLVADARLGREAERLGAQALLTPPYSLNDVLETLQRATGSMAVSSRVRSSDTLNTGLHAQPTKKRMALPDTVVDVRTQSGAKSLPTPVVCQKRETTSSKAAPVMPPVRKKTINPLLLSRQGLQLLRDDNYEEAEKLLHAALEYDPLDLESCLGLMRLEKRRDNEKAAARWLRRAAIICLRSGQEERAAELFERLPAAMQGKNHFLEEAGTLLREGSYQTAAKAFLEAWARQSEEPLHGMIGRACQFTDAPEAALRGLCRAYARSGEDQIAQSLAARLSHDPWHGYQTPGFLRAFPLLHDAVEVIKFTLKAWRNAPI